MNVVKIVFSPSTRTQEIANAVVARIESACSVKKDPQLFL